MKIALVMTFIFAAFFPPKCTHDFKTCFYAKHEFNTCNISCVKKMNVQCQNRTILAKNKHFHSPKITRIYRYDSARHLRYLIKSLLH